MLENTHDTSNTKKSYIDLDIMVKDVLRQWWVILLAAAAAALFAGAWTKFTYAPTYATATTFVVGTSGFSSNLAYDNLRSAEKVTTSFSQVVGSSVLKKQVCEELGLSSFDAEVTVGIVANSNLMTMQVTADSPEKAYRMIHSVMDAAMELTGELMDQVAVKVLQEPVIPAAPNNTPNVRGQMKKAAAAGAAAMALLFAVLSYFKDTVKNAQGASAKLDMKLLGTIYHEKKYKTFKERLKKSHFALNIENPMVSFAYVESVRMLATKVRSAMDRQGAKVLLVTSVSENEGKSTVAANLALSLSQEEKKVILIDCDFRKPSQYKIFGLEKERLQESDFAEALIEIKPVKIIKAGEDRKLGIICTQTPRQNLLTQEVTARLQGVLALLKKKADYIIIDTSPMALASDGEAMAGLAEASLLVVKQDMMEAKYINDTVDQMNRTKAKVLGCVFNNVYPGFFARSREYGHYYGYGYSRYYGKYGYHSHYDTKSSRKQVQES